ncbi:hypothetical protein TrispH2_003717 [Trichoplax sp. H2]|nr:hypothetical protein TrispH2_003717 [Trichoplax sp. H2]|eukprot:RDD44575.1 hypothetical protein TrispH2_003717 [Trichoplax sp. H2]
MSRRTNVAMKTRIVNGAADKLLQLKVDKLELEQTNSLDVLKKQQRQIKDELCRALRINKSPQTSMTLPVHKQNINRRRSASAIVLSSDMEEFHHSQAEQANPHHSGNRSRAESMKPILASSISVPDHRLFSSTNETASHQEPTTTPTSRSASCSSWYGQIDDDDDDIEEEDHDHHGCSHSPKGIKGNARKLPKPNVKISLELDGGKIGNRATHHHSSSHKTSSQRLEPLFNNKNSFLSVELSTQVLTNGKKGVKQSRSLTTVDGRKSLDRQQHQQQLSLPPMRKALSSGSINLISNNNN